MDEKLYRYVDHTNTTVTSQLEPYPDSLPDGTLIGIYILNKVVRVKKTTTLVEEDF